jgi:hypothetical protein
VAKLSVFPRLFKMTVFSRWYDEKDAFARRHEFHFRASRRGSIRTVRETLARRGIRYFQHAIYRWHHQWIPEHKIRFNFETEEQAVAVDRAIKVYIRSMRYRGKQWMATKLPPRVIPYGKRNRRTKTRKGKRAKGR